MTVVSDEQVSKGVWFGGGQDEAQHGPHDDDDPFIWVELSASNASNAARPQSATDPITGCPPACACCGA